MSVFDPGRIVPVAALILSCSAPPAPTPSRANEGDTAAAVAAAPAAALDPPPPEGVVIPKIGRVREVRAGRPSDAFVWTAVFDADPGEPRIREILAKDTTTPLRPDRYDAGDAAAMLYADQVRAAGIETHNLEASFDYSIQDGKYVVIVRPDDDFHKDDPNGFSVVVSIPGG